MNTIQLTPPESPSSSLKTALDTGMQAAESLVQSAEENVIEPAKRVAGDVAAKARDGYRQAEHWVSSHPSTSVGMAFGVGILVGLLAARL